MIAEIRILANLDTGEVKTFAPFGQKKLCLTMLKEAKKSIQEFSAAPVKKDAPAADKPQTKTLWTPDRKPVVKVPLEIIGGQKG